MTREKPKPSDPYRVLGIGPDASRAQITSAYRALAKYWHPDTNPSPDAPEHLARVIDAYQQLQCPAAPAADPGGTTRDDPPTHVAPRPPRPRGATVVAGPVRVHGLPPTWGSGPQRFAHREGRAMENSPWPNHSHPQSGRMTTEIRELSGAVVCQVVGPIDRSTGSRLTHALNLA
ncbi:J domain-containing protein [Streptacidiphilus rugosus]|uniref:J domain-containing protein n=1 Tax=Streptacidiphilus rugosus TaxID=405783 RepID=UPI000691FF07|nr:J domain-containing protein [Streptacidiphilus rugosus]